MTASAKAVVERLTEEVWNRGDLDVIDELVAETFVDHWALAGERDGREGLRELVRHVREAFPDFHNTRFEVIGEDNWIGERWSAVGTHKGPFLGVPPTGAGQPARRRVLPDRAQPGGRETTASSMS